MRIMLTIAAASMMVPTIAVAQTDMSGSTSMSSKPMKSSKPKKHKTTNGAMSSGTTGQTSNTESGQTTPQSAPGASTDGSMPDKSSSAPIATSGTTPPQ